MSDRSCRIVPFDVRDFARLNYAWIIQLFAVEPPDQRILDNPEAEIIAPGGEVFFALIGDAVVGTVALKREDGVTFELTKLAVDESMRGKGCGNLLLQAALQWARNKGAARVVLSSHTSLNAAIAMYRKAGFVDQGAHSESCYSRCNVFMELALKA